jgi:hypothetical protein
MLVSPSTLLMAKGSNYVFFLSCHRLGLLICSDTELIPKVCIFRHLLDSSEGGSVHRETSTYEGVSKSFRTESIAK